MTSSFLERKIERLQKTSNHHISQAGNGINMIIETRQKMFKMGQMTIPKRQKGTELWKHQLSAIPVKENTSWTERLTMTTSFNDQARATRQA